MISVSVPFVGRGLRVFWRGDQFPKHSGWDCEPFQQLQPCHYHHSLHINYSFHGKTFSFYFAKYSKRTECLLISYFLSWSINISVVPTCLRRELIVVVFVWWFYIDVVGKVGVDGGQKAFPMISTVTEGPTHKVSGLHTKPSTLDKVKQQQSKNCAKSTCCFQKHSQTH